MKKAPSIGVVLVNYKGLDDTLECLGSMRNLTYPAFFTIVVDNASGNDEAARIAEAFSEVDVLPQPENLGFTGGNNVGVRRALERGADYVFFLNNDTTVPPNLLDVLTSALASDPELGAVGPLMLYYSEPEVVAGGGARLDYKGRCYNYLGDVSLGSVDRKKPFDVEFIHGSALMVPRSVIEGVGLLDERFFLNYEEIDLCARIRAAGYRVVTIPEAHYWHKIGRSIGTNSPIARYYMSRNRLLFLWKRRRFVGLALALAATMVNGRRESNPTLRRVQGRAVRDFLTGRFGHAKGIP